VFEVLQQCCCSVATSVEQPWQQVKQPCDAVSIVGADITLRGLTLMLLAMQVPQPSDNSCCFCCCCLWLAGGRSARLVNPIAWEKGAVFAQCQHCEVWHTLAAHPSIIEEIRYNDPEWQQQQQQASGAAAPGEYVRFKGAAHLASIA
jgi:hypothetical protein